MKTLLTCLLLLVPLGSGALHAEPDISPKAYSEAAALFKADKFAEAEKAAQVLVAARTIALGPEDKETLRAIYAKRAYAGRLKVLGKDHPSTLASQRLVDKLAK